MSKHVIQVEVTLDDKWDEAQKAWKLDALMRDIEDLAQTGDIVSAEEEPDPGWCDECNGQCRDESEWEEEEA